MAKDVEVNLNVKANTEATIANLKKLKKQLKETAAGSEEFNKISAQIRDMDDAIKDASKTSDDFLGYLENSSGPLGILGKGIRSAEQTFSSFNAVIKASAIGLLVGLIGGLVAAFNDSEKATKKLQPLFTGLEKIFNGVYSAIEPLFNILVDLAISALPLVSKAMQTVYGSVTATVQSLGSLGSAVAKFVKGDFSGAWKSAKASVTDFGKNYDESIKRFQEGSKELTKVEKEEFDKRKKARDEAYKQLQAQREEERKRLVEIENQNLQIEGEMQMKAFDKLAEEENQRMQEQGQALFEEYDARQKALATYEANVTADAKEQAEERKNLVKAENEAKLALQEAYVSNTMRIGQGLRQIAGENKELAIAGIVLEQAAAIASIAINTQKNAAKYGYLTPMGIAELVAGGLGVASAISAARKGIQDINSGNASGSQMSFGNPQMTPSYQTAPRFNVVGTNPVNQIAQVVGNQAPIEAYVVSSKVTTAQALDRNKIVSATLG